MSTSTTRAAMASAVALSVVASASAQDAVQWRVEDGGNGHWYRLEARTNRDWPTLRTAAEFEGGHLATMTSPQEKSWMLTAIMAGTNCFLGGYQDPNGVEPAGGWRWVTNEPFDWTSWNSGEPNNHPPSGDEDVMGCWASGDWVDVNTIGWAWPCNHAVFEWSADCNNDGLVDYGQIRAGDLADANGNNIPDCCEPGAGACPGDLVRDGRVDGVDLAAVLNNWGLSEGAALNADANCDGVVDGQDLATVLGSWGKCP